MPVSAHIPVLVQETLEALAVQPGGRYVDCTLGTGGHAAAILDRSSPGGQLLGIDADPEAVTVAGNKLEVYRSSVQLVNNNFVNLEAICIKFDFFPVHGILFDLGLSSFQLNSEGRGFSFQQDAPLDMRFSPDQDVTAADIVNTSSEAELNHLIKKYGEESYSHSIAHHIIENRPIESTLQLVRTIEKAVGGRKGRLHPATKTFQALRIAVNHELEYLKAALKQAVDLLGFEGRLVVISYHSLEDRIVKQFMQKESRDCICPPNVPTCVCGHKASLRLINKKAITPSQAERQLNPRSRSAKLRMAEHIITNDGYYRPIEEYRFSPQFEVKGWKRPALLKKLRSVFSSL